MNESYFEIMVAKQVSPITRIAKIVAAILTVFFLIAGIIGIIPAFLPGGLCALGWYFLNLYGSVEYEYLYVDKELQIDRILGKSKRKRMETLDVNQLEILAPARSHELDRYRNVKAEKKDFTSGSGDNRDDVYVMVIGGKQIFFEPTPELVKTIQMFAPRKVFTY